jgi:hypothetical protein
MFILYSAALYSQDTIFVRNGQVIPATIVEKNGVEIKYKKPGQAEPAAIYSIFVSDVLRIHFSEGIIADYTKIGRIETVQPERPVEIAGTMKAIKFSIGLSGEYFNRKEEDDLMIFWRDKTNIPAAGINSNPYSVPINLKMTFNLGNSARNWLGDELQLILTPADAINASSNNGAYEIKLRSFYYNIIIFYGRTLNHKKTLAAIIEPGLDLSFMMGYIKLDNVKYKINGNFGSGFHLAAGTDWMISKRLMLTARAGQRFMKVKESHVDEGSSTGYSYFYVQPGVNNDQLSIKWNGPYFTVGLSWCMYSRMKLNNTD